MSGQSGGYRLHLSTLNDQLTCKLCGGYFIDATTIIECLHSFCRSCIIKYLEHNKYCPICEVQVHKSKPLLNIRPDHTLQDIVYKLVPGCYQNEMRCRREFYSKYPEARSQTSSPESRGEPIESHIYSLDEALSLSLEYYIPSPKDQAESEKESTAKTLPRRYLRCPAAVTIFHLQKLIRAKYGLSSAHRVDIMYKEEPLCGNYTLMDVMYIYHWRRKVPLHLSYRIFESAPKRIKLSEDNTAYEQILSNTRVASHEMKSEQSEKREWKEVQLKISETGVMSVTDISTFEKKNVSNGDGKSEELVTVDKSTVGRNEIVDKIEKKNKFEAIKDTKRDASEKLSSQAAQNTPTTNIEVSKNTGNTSLEVETRKSVGKTDENANAGGSELQKLNPMPKKSEDSLKAVTRSDTEGENLGSSSQKFNNQSKLKNNSMRELNLVKNSQESLNTKKVDDRSVNTNNNFISAEGKADSPRETAKSGGKEMKNAATSVELKQNMQSTVLPFQPKVGQVNNTYSKKIPKEKKSLPIGSRKLDPILMPDQPKCDVKSPAHFANTKSQATATVSLAKQTTCVISPLQSTAMSTQTVNTFVSAPLGSCTFVSAPQITTCVSVNSTAVSSMQNSLSPNKAVLLSPQNLDCQAVKASDQRPGSAAKVKSESAGQKVPLAKNNNNNNNPSSSSQSLASIGLNVSTAMPSLTETSSSNSYTVHNLVSPPQAKNMDFKSEKINSSNEKHGSNALDTQSLNIYSVATPTANNPRFTTSQTPIAAKRTNSQSGLEITSIYTVPPCPDAIPISLMKPTVRKHEIIAKGTNLNEICAKIGESSKEKIKAATRSKPEIPNLLKITKKNAADTSKSIPSVHNFPTYVSTNNMNLSEEKANDCASKETPKTSSAVANSQSVSTSMTSQKTCSAKKQSQSVGYKTLRDPPKSWNPTLSKNNYVAARNQAKEMQNLTQGTSVSGGSSVKPIPSKPAKIFKMRNVPRYLGNPASGVKPMYGISNESKDKDSTAQNAQKSSSLSMMTIDPKTLSPIVSTANSPIISPPPPYSPNARNYPNSQFPREICPHPGSPIASRNSPINMLSTNPFIPSPTLNTNPRLIYTHFPPPFPDTSRFPNPLIRSPIGIPSPSAFHSSLPASINKYQRSNYHVPATSYAPPTPPPPPAIQKIIPSIHSSPKSPKPSAAISTSPLFALGKTEPQLSTRVENIALHLAKNVAKQELNIFNFSKTGNPAATNFQNLSTTTTVTLSTSGYSSLETSQNVTTQTTARSKPPLETKMPKTDAFKVKSKDPKAVDLENSDEPLTSKAKIPEGRGERILDKDIDMKEKTVAKINGEIVTEVKAVPLVESDKETPSINTETNSAPTAKESGLTEASETAEKSVEISSDKVSNEVKNEEAVCKTADQIQGKKSDVQRNKPES